MNRRASALYEWVEHRFFSLANRAAAALPQRPPAAEKLQSVRIIAHRGIHHGNPQQENTRLAFDRSCIAGLWGIELDIRWTRDLVPVVYHDPDLGRVYGQMLQVRDLPWSELHRQAPAVPRLEEVVAAYGRRLHLMLEIKAEPWPAPIRQLEILQTILKPLQPMRDFHWLSLTPAMFTFLTGFPRASLLPVARLNLNPLSQASLKASWGGVLGHFALIHQPLITRHHQAGQQVGTGFVDSLPALHRELRRGVDWIFSNRPELLQQALTTRQGDVPPG